MLAQLGITVNYATETENKISQLRLGVRIAAATILLLSLLMASLFVHVINRLYRQCTDVNPDLLCSVCSCDQFNTFMHALGWLTGIIYTTITALLIASYTYLRRAMTGRAFQLADFSQDVNRLYLVLVIVFTTQTVYLYF